MIIRPMIDQNTFVPAGPANAPADRGGRLMCNRGSKKAEPGVYLAR